MQNHITVYLVEESSSERREMAFRLGAAGIETWTFTSNSSFLDSVGSLKPRPILFTTSAAPFQSDLVTLLRERKVDWPLIALSRDSDVASAINLMKQGVFDLLVKPVDEEKLQNAILSASGLLEDQLAVREVRHAAERRIKALTRREISICTALLSGQPNKVISHNLGISIRTVEAHRSNVMMKTGARNFAEVFMLLTRAGVEPDPLLKPRRTRYDVPADDRNRFVAGFQQAA